jgi:cytochrome c oxidase subunit 2
MSATPLAYLTASGPRAAHTAPLTWYMLIVSILVCVIVTALVWIAARRSHGTGGAAETVAVPIERGADGFPWVKWGLVLSAIPLITSLVWTMAVLARVAGPPADTKLSIDVTGRQYWWQATYDGPAPRQHFSTANEIHIPVGVPVLVRLHGADVIHSFWVPQLAGKTDAIPGQNNVTWLQADRPGRYRGQCTEYCGLQHAKMAFEVVAEPRDRFELWRAHQEALAPPPTDGATRFGQAVFEHRCASCHAIRGTPAQGVIGPDLTHLKDRSLIGSGALPNSAGAVAGWIQSPQTVKPGSTMPDQNLSGPELVAVSAYLETLK